MRSPVTASVEKWRILVAASKTGSTPTRGFASMDRDRQREIARKGGRSVPGMKRSFARSQQLASDAGRKGGRSSHGPRPAPAKS